MKLICSQPSTLYSEWQLLVLIQSIRKFEGEVKLDIIMLGDKIESLDKASHIFPWLKIFYYNDNVQRSRSYSPNNKIFGYVNHWNAYPELENEYMLFVDADCLLMNIPKIPSDNIHYGDNASIYLPKNKQLESEIHFESDLVPIGLCYYGKGYTKKFWESVYIDSYKLINSSFKYYRWTTEMRCWFYNLIKFGFETKPHEELECANGDKFSKNIHHHTENIYLDKSMYKDEYPWDIQSTRIPTNSSSINYYNAIIDCKNNLLKLL